MKTQGFAVSALASALTVLACAGQSAETAPMPAPSATPLEIGTAAPNFAFTPVTTGGIGKKTTLASLKGQTVVMWFFPKARTRG
jgi:hypothetical protein